MPTSENTPNSSDTGEPIPFDAAKMLIEEKTDDQKAAGVVMAIKNAGLPPYSGHWHDVFLFMKHAGQELPDEIGIPSEAVRKLRAALILEEALETVKALGFNATVRGVSVQKNIDLMAAYTPDLEEVFDGCADLSVVTEGTLIAFGMPDRALYHLVDLNNLEKFGPGSRKREDGKWIKPPGHRPPPIKALVNVLRLQNWRPSADEQLRS